MSAARACSTAGASLVTENMTESLDDLEQARRGISRISAFARRYSRIILGIPLALGLFGAASGALWPKYTARSVIRPVSSEANLSRFAGLAAQFGVAMPIGGDANSVDFYARLVLSRGVLERVAQAPLVAVDSRTVSIAAAVSKPRKTMRDSLRDATDWLEERTSLGIDITTGLLTVETKAPSDTLAERINRQYLTEIDSFNLRASQSLAAAEREFLELRVQAAEATLTESERALQSFFQDNRSWQGSPDLVFEEGRLRRRNDIAQQVFLSLTQALEQARIEEVRNTPVVTIVEGPEGSARPASLVLRTAKFLSLGIVLATMLALTIETIVLLSPSGSAFPDRVLGAARRLHLLT